MKRIWLTGASSGIGATLAEILLTQGHFLAVSARNVQALEKLHTDYPQQVLLLPGDLTEPREVRAMGERIEQVWGYLDQVILNAGTCEYLDVGTFEAKMIERVMRANLFSAVYCVEAALPAKKTVDFIQRYIFPGGALPSMCAMLQTITRDTDLNLHHMEDFGLHYARTLRLWHDNLRRSRHNLEALGYDQTFYRLWEFYLSYCEGGFLERSIGTAQLLLAKPAARPQPFGLEA